MSKETQNKWEYKLSQIMYKDYNDEELSDDLVEKVKQIENEAYQRGKRETLEEVRLAIQDIDIERGQEELIDKVAQTINKMK